MQLELVLRRCVGGGSRFRVELVVADELLLNNRFTFSSLNHFFASAFPAVPLSSSKKYRSAIPIERSRTISCVYDVSRRWRWRWRWRRRFEFARSSAVPKRKVRREIVRLVPGRPSVAPRSLFVQRAQVSLYEGTRVPGVLGAMRIHLYTVPVSASADAAESERTSVPLCRILVGPEAYW
eukprot:515869-Rhodomonas_salina.2